MLVDLISWSAEDSRCGGHRRPAFYHRACRANVQFDSKNLRPMSTDSSGGINRDESNGIVRNTLSLHYHSVSDVALLRLPRLYPIVIRVVSLRWSPPPFSRRSDALVKLPKYPVVDILPLLPFSRQEANPAESCTLIASMLGLRSNPACAISL